MVRDRTHFLLVGDEGDIAMIHTILRRLPVDAYGQVYIEVDGARPLPSLAMPEGMELTWLRRDSRVRRGGSAHDHGALAAGVIDVWLQEWMPDADAAEEPYVIWIGCTASGRVDLLYRDLRARLPMLHVRHPHYDSPR